MKVRNIKIRHLQIPLRLRFSQSNQTVDHSSSVIVRVETENDILGYGEACPRVHITGESPQSVEDDIRVNDYLICSESFDSIADIRSLVLDKLPLLMRPAAVCGVELALLDAWAKEHHTTVFEALGANLPASITYSGMIPYCNLEAIEPLLSRFCFKDLNLKIGRNLIGGLGRIRQLRSIFGRNITIRTDVNEAWTPEIARQQIPMYLHHGVTSFEQMFPKDRTEDFQQIMAAFGDRVSIMLDESLTTKESAAYLIDEKIGNHFNLKISKHGGIFHTLEICKLAREHGIPCQLGAHFGETSILTAAGMIVAALNPDLTAREGAMGTWILKKDICFQPWMVDPCGDLSTSLFTRPSTGWGIEIDQNVVEKYSKPSVMNLHL